MRFACAITHYEVQALQLTMTSLLPAPACCLRQLSAAPPAAALPRRRTPSPPPPLVDDSPQHTIEYITAALSQPATLGEEDPGTSGSLPNVTLLPDVITAGEEPPLSLAGYLWLERDFKPEWSQLADGRDSDERHIWHKALYDAANQALGQAYEAAGRLQVGCLTWLTAGLIHLMLDCLPYHLLGCYTWLAFDL